MVVVFGIAFATGGYGSLVMFAIVSFLAMREFITLTPTRRADHRALFWTFFLVPARCSTSSSRSAGTACSRS